LILSRHLSQNKYKLILSQHLDLRRTPCPDTRFFVSSALVWRLIPEFKAVVSSFSVPWSSKGLVNLLAMLDWHRHLSLVSHLKSVFLMGKSCTFAPLFSNLTNFFC